MELTYIYHSGYMIESDRFVIIIDYYKDSQTEGGVVHKKLQTTSKKIYIMCTHSHYDHFNPEILIWKQNRPDIVYIFSKDVLEHKMVAENDVVYLDKFDVYEDDMLSLKVFGSTDLGISFLIRAEGKTIFHAGDLNNWHWNEEASDTEIREAEAFYETELQLLADEVQHVNLAMFPIDPRLGKDYMKGAEQFVEKIKTDIFAPMHFGESYKKAAAFKAYCEDHSSKLICWTGKGQSIHF